MQCTLRLEVPPGISAFLIAIIPLPPPRAEPRRAAAPVQEPPPRSPRGPQLWLVYPGAECDEHGWRLAQF